jgi:spermidine synthase
VRLDSRRDFDDSRAMYPSRLLLTLLLGVAACQPPSEVGGVVHEERSLYRNIYVAEQDGERCLYFRLRGNPGKQSCIDLDEPDRLVSEYSRLMMAGLYVQPQPRRILMIGLGGGVVPRVLQKLLPDAEIDVVEIDPAVVRVAGSHFGFEAGPRMHVHEADGRVFVKRQLAAGVKYDLVMLDAYEDEYIPEHLLTVEFLREVAGLLSPEGAVVANTWSSSGLYDHESVTYEAAFGRFLNFKSLNRIVVAGPAAAQPRARIEANAARWEQPLAPFGVRGPDLLSRLRADRDWDARADVLTDQYSPSNILNSRGSN